MKEKEVWTWIFNKSLVIYIAMCIFMFLFIRRKCINGILKAVKTCRDCILFLIVHKIVKQIFNAKKRILFIYFFHIFFETSVVFHL